MGYMPHDFRRLPSLVNVGYFFINFISPEIAGRAWDTFAGFRDWVMDSRKVLCPAWATKTQGKAACLERYQDSPVMHQVIPAECKPMVVENGTLVPLHNCSSKKVIKQPRIKPIRKGRE